MTIPPIPVIGIVVGSDETVAPWSSYLTVAHSLASGSIALDAADYSTHAANALICCHMLECILKSIVCHSKGDDRLLNSNEVRHNLSGLWALACDCGLPRNKEAPFWVQQLSFLHDKPYRLRYSKGFVGVAIPNPEPARTELLTLLNLAETIVK